MGRKISSFPDHLHALPDHKKRAGKVWAGKTWAGTSCNQPKLPLYYANKSSAVSTQIPKRTFINLTNSQELRSHFEGIDSLENSGKEDGGNSTDFVASDDENQPETSTYLTKSIYTL